MNAKVQTIENDIDGIQTVGQAVAPVVEEAGRQMVARKDTGPLAIADMTPMQMAYQLIQSGADLGSVKEMLALSKELAADQAKRSFDEAVAAAKASIPTISKNAKGHQEKRYANFAAYAAIVDPIIAAHGLHYRFRTAQTDKITVTCILSHKAGHSEENSLSGPADASGSKNAIQAIGSTLTYLQRYTLIQALGLAAGDDDDGKAASVNDQDFITEKQVMELRDLLEAKGANEAKFVKFIGVMSLDKIYADAFDRAVEIVQTYKGAAA